MTHRIAHGDQRARGRLVVSECPPLDELRPATGALTVRSDRTPDGRFKPGNRAASAKLVRAGQRGALATLDKQGDPAARAALAYGQRYSAHRRAELSRAHGQISAGVAAMIESAARLLAESRYWSARGMAEGDPDFTRLGVTAAAGARQAERDAWAMASLEAATRTTANPLHAAILAAGEAK